MIIPKAQILLCGQRGYENVYSLFSSQSYSVEKFPATVCIPKCYEAVLSQGGQTGDIIPGLVLDSSFPGRRL